MIVLDSNQLRHVLPGKPLYGLLSAVARRAGHTLATTDVVLAEVVRQRREDLGAALKAWTEAGFEARRLMITDRHQIGGLAVHPQQLHGRRRRITYEQSAELETRLRAAFLVLNTLPEDALLAILMEAQHLPPCEHGRGARDATIYLTTLRAAVAPEISASGEALPLMFVSQDGDFSRFDLPEGRELDALREVRVLHQRTVVATLNALGFPKSSAKADDVVARPEFQQALIDAITNSPIMPPRLLRQAQEAAEVRIRRLAGGPAESCTGDGVTVTSMTGEWSIRFVEQVMPPRLDGRPGGYRGFPMRAEGTALLVDGPPHPPSVELNSLVLSFPDR
ncbi:hypothetical protein [Microbispora sp. H13382]|uniref:hypothetical protein n=1 Tax=Microbispora sp. H13382 TaxID=2729112 RepID=UPI001602B8BF|nr:hypothetical protein [Microbispora sp. H13382]